VGYDAGKQVKGRKRHLLVDTLGLVWGILITAGDIQDYDAGYWLLLLLRALGKLPRLLKLWVDAIYSRHEFPARVEARFPHLQVEVIGKPPKGTGFQLSAHRWIVERTFAWLGRFRRLSKDYEFHLTTSKTMIELAMIHIMIRRLKRR
jgi:putative transposase